MLQCGDVPWPGMTRGKGGGVMSCSWDFEYHLEKVVLGHYVNIYIYILYIYIYHKSIYIYIYCKYIYIYTSQVYIYIYL